MSQTFRAARETWRACSRSARNYESRAALRREKRAAGRRGAQPARGTAERRRRAHKRAPKRRRAPPALSFAGEVRRGQAAEKRPHGGQRAAERGISALMSRAAPRADNVAPAPSYNCAVIGQGGRLRSYQPAAVSRRFGGGPRRATLTARRRPSRSFTFDGEPRS